VLKIYFLFFSACGRVEGPQVLWDFKTGGFINTKPVVFKGLVFISSDKLYCLDKETGRLLWDHETLGNMRSSAVISEENRIYFSIGGLYCLDVFTGNIIWEFWRGGWTDNQPVVDSDRVYNMAGKKIYCLDACNGSLIWDKEVEQSSQPPLFLDGHIFVWRRFFYCFFNQGAMVL